MRQRLIANLLATHADTPIVDPVSAGQIKLSKKEEQEIKPLFELAAKLQETMRPVQPRTPFVKELKNDLMYRARRRLAVNKRKRSIFVIAAAIVGSLVSIASVVGAVVLLVKTIHERTQARAALHAPQA